MRLSPAYSVERDEAARTGSLSMWWRIRALMLVDPVCMLVLAMHEFQYTRKQAAFIRADVQFMLMVSGVGGGKSTAGGMWKMQRAITYPRGIGLIAANTFKQLNTTTLKKYCDLLDLAGIPYIFNKRPPDHWHIKSAFKEHDGILTWGTGRQEICTSLENFNALRGVELCDAWLDETRDTDPAALDVIIGRFRGFDHIYPGIAYQMRVTTTPNGFDHVWRRFVNPSTKWANSGFVQCSSRDNTFLPPSYVAALRASYSKQLAQQEIEGEFVNIAAGRAFSFSRERNVSANECVYRPELPLYFSLDHNVAPLCGCVLQFDKKQRLGWCLEEIYIPDSAHTYEACREFVRRWKDKGVDTVRLHGDASGKARNTVTEDTNHSIMVKEIKPHFPRVEESWDRSNPTQFARIQATNAMLEPAEGAARLYVHPSCENLIVDLESVVFKPGTQEIDKSDPLRSHVSDAFSYPVFSLFPYIDRGRSGIGFSGPF